MKTTEQQLRKGCGLRESVGSPICNINCLCNDCENKLEGYKLAKEEFLKMIDELEEPINRWNLGLNNQEMLAYFNGYEDTKIELKAKLEKKE